MCGTSDKTSDAGGLSDEELLSLYQASGDETYFEIIESVRVRHSANGDG